MTTKQINPPATIWGGYSTGNGEQQILECVNTSGVTLAHGDVVVVDNSAGQMPTAPGSITGAVTTTTTASDPKVVGVVTIDATANTNGGIIQPGGVCYVVMAGVARVQIAANTVTVGQALASSATAKVAAVPATAGSVGALQALAGSFIGIALEANTAKDANNTIRCMMKSS